jgi:glycosyltransferase involved in cell wall biosynthesis
MLSFIIPAHNEEALIASTIRAIRTATDGLAAPVEIIVVDDASTDRTAAIAAAEGARVVPAQVRQIAAARNAGAAVARGSIFVFVDADTIVGAAVVRALVAAMAAGAVGGGAAIQFDEPTPRYSRWPLAMLNVSCRLWHWAAGAFIFCRREAFEAAGGFDARLFAGEEVYFSRAMRRRGRFVILREPVVTSGRKLRTHSAWEILWTVVKIGAAGPWGVRSRRRLGLWYGERRRDPAK